MASVSDEFTKKMTQNLCRLCLQSPEKDKLIWIFDSRMIKNMNNIIHHTSGVEILENDPISQKVCMTCLEVTVAMYKFRTASIKNNRDLMKRYESLTKPKQQTIDLCVNSPEPPNDSDKPQEIDTTNQDKGASENFTMHKSVLKILQKYPTLSLTNVPLDKNYDCSLVLEINKECKRKLVVSEKPLLKDSINEEPKTINPTQTETNVENNVQNASSLLGDLDFVKAKTSTKRKKSSEESEPANETQESSKSSLENIFQSTSSSLPSESKRKKLTHILGLNSFGSRKGKLESTPVSSPLKNLNITPVTMAQDTSNENIIDRSDFHSTASQISELTLSRTEVLTIDYRAETAENSRKEIDVVNEEKAKDVEEVIQIDTDDGEAVKHTRVEDESKKSTKNKNQKSSKNRIAPEIGSKHEESKKASKNKRVQDNSFQCGELKGTTTRLETLQENFNQDEGRQENSKGLHENCLEVEESAPGNKESERKYPDVEKSRVLDPSKELEKEACNVEGSQEIVLQNEESEENSPENEQSPKDAPKNLKPQEINSKHRKRMSLRSEILRENSFLFKLISEETSEIKKFSENSNKSEKFPTNSMQNKESQENVHETNENVVESEIDEISENSKKSFLEHLNIMPKNSSEELSTATKSIPLYSCNICNTFCSSEREVKKHKLHFHTTCQFCKGRFRTIFAKNEHIKNRCEFKKAVAIDFSIKLIRVDEDPEIRRLYPSAFNNYLEKNGENEGEKNETSDGVLDFEQNILKMDQIDIEEVILQSPKKDFEFIENRENDTNEDIQIKTRESPVTKRVIENEVKVEPVQVKKIHPKINVTDFQMMEEIGNKTHFEVLELLLQKLMENSEEGSTSLEDESEQSKHLLPMTSEIRHGTDNTNLIFPNLKLHLLQYRIQVDLENFTGNGIIGEYKYDDPTMASNKNLASHAPRTHQSIQDIAKLNKKIVQQEISKPTSNTIERELLKPSNVPNEGVVNNQNLIVPNEKRTREPIVYEILDDDPDIVPFPSVSNSKKVDPVNIIPKDINSSSTMNNWINPRKNRNVIQQTPSTSKKKNIAKPTKISDKNALCGSHIIFTTNQMNERTKQYKRLASFNNRTVRNEAETSVNNLTQTPASNPASNLEGLATNTLIHSNVLNMVCVPRNLLFQTSTPSTSTSSLTSNATLTNTVPAPVLPSTSDQNQPAKTPLQYPSIRIRDLNELK